MIAFSTSYVTSSIIMLSRDCAAEFGAVACVDWGMRVDSREFGLLNFAVTLCNGDRIDLSYDTIGDEHRRAFQE